MPTTRELPVVPLEGSAFERGRQHGELLSEQIAEFMELWRKDIRATLQVDADDFARRFVGGSGFAGAAEDHTPELLDEVRGLAEGAGLTWETAMCLQLVDEYWEQGASLVSERCSAVGLVRPATGETFIAQNIDCEAYRDGFQVVMHHLPDEGPEVFIVTNPGLVAMNGMNSAGVAVAVNSLPELNSRSDGLPVAFVVRGILACRTIEEAERFVRSVRHASGQNYLIGAPGVILDLECSAGATVEHATGANNVAHTNHALSSRDRRVDQAASSQRLATAAEGPFANSEVRLASLESRLSGGDVGVDELKAVLRSTDDDRHPICRTNRGGGGFTFASTIATISPEPKLLVSPGPPDVNAYHPFTFEGPRLAPT